MKPPSKAAIVLSSLIAGVVPLALTVRGSARASLRWVGALDYMLSLCAATLSASLASTIESPTEAGLWGAIGVGSLLSLVALLWNLKPEA